MNLERALNWIIGQCATTHPSIPTPKDFPPSDSLIPLFLTLLCLGLDEGGQSIPISSSKRQLIQFSRSCQGVHFAEATLFITMCTLLMVFDIRPIRDQHGNFVLPKPRKEQNMLIR